MREIYNKHCPEIEEMIRQQRITEENRRNYLFEIELPEGKGENLFTNNYETAILTALEFGKGAKVIILNNPKGEN